MSDGDTLLLPARVSLVHPVVSCAHYFQALATRCKCNIQFSVRLEFLNQLQGLTTCCRENGKIGLPEISYNLCNFIVNKLRLEGVWEDKIIHYSIWEGEFSGPICMASYRKPMVTCSQVFLALATSFMCFPQDPFRLPYYLEKPLNFTRCPWIQLIVE